MTGKDVIRLVPKDEGKRTKGTQSTIKLLKSLLKQARKGEIEGLGVAVLYTSGSASFGWTEPLPYYRTMGAIADLQHEYFEASR